MPIRKPHVGKAVITKRHVEDALKFTSLDHVTITRGAGTVITGNVGTTYAELAAAVLHINPALYQQVRKVEALFRWDPQTTAGGIQLYNWTDAEVLAVSEPGAAGIRIDRINITDKWKTLIGDKSFWVRSKGDGTTAPTIEYVMLVIETGNV